MNGWFAALLPILLAPVSAWAAGSQSFDLGIESMRSHSYSVGIFVFMMIAIAVFVGIMFAHFRPKKGEKVKTGEKMLFGWIIVGVIAAILFAAVQLLDGILF